MKAVDKDHDNTNSGIGEFLATASVKDLAAQKTAKWFNIWQVESGTLANEVTS